MGTLYLVATPIGNLGDISRRALEILAQVGLIAAEDTRHTGVLLAHYAIRTPAVSYHEHNKLARLDRILAALAVGDVALVSDAGMPGINDPGYELVRAALAAGFPVSPIPGPSAPVAALAASGLPTDRFLYLGYLPRKSSERQALLAEIATMPYTLIFLETPHRLLDALADLQAGLGERHMAAARELTKIYEEIVRGSFSQVQAHFTQNPPRGEFTLVVAGYSGSSTWDEARVRAALSEQLAHDITPSQAATLVAAQAGWKKRAVYALINKESDE